MPAEKGKPRIDRARLAELAGDPAIKSNDLAGFFQMGPAEFFRRLSHSEELWRVYEDARTRAGVEVCSTMPVSLRRKYRAKLSPDELVIINAIPSGRTIGELRAAAIAGGVDLGKFAKILYDLEHEKHEIFSAEVGRPLATHFFLRGEEQPADSPFGRGNTVWEKKEDREKGKAAVSFRNQPKHTRCCRCGTGLSLVLPKNKLARFPDGRRTGWCAKCESRVYEAKGKAA
jgi:hypothetical protein